MNKLFTLHEALCDIGNGSSVAFGGNVLHRSPNLIAAALALKGVQNLHIIKTAAAFEVDVLCAMNCVGIVSAGFVGYEAQYGLCSFYRKSVENGEVIANEQACYSIITGLRAAAFGVPFLPIRGFNGSDLIQAVGLKYVKDPYEGEELIAIKAFHPDVAFLHVQKADGKGNCEIVGPTYEDVIIAKSAEKVIVTCECLVDETYFGEKKKADISEVLVTKVVHLPNGGKPGSCFGVYPIDYALMEEVKKTKSKNEMKLFLERMTEDVEL